MHSSGAVVGCMLQMTGLNCRSLHICFVVANFYKDVLFCPVNRFSVISYFTGIPYSPPPRCSGGLSSQHVGSSVEVPDPAVDWNFNEWVNLTTVYLSMVLCADHLI